MTISIRSAIDKNSLGGYVFHTKIRIICTIITGPLIIKEVEY